MCSDNILIIYRGKILQNVIHKLDKGFVIFSTSLKNDLVM